MFGTILHRMIFWELVRVFLLALVTLTGLFLLAGLVAEATQRGLSPTQVLMVIPLVAPNALPYTIPTAALFATCVVYGRLSHDNEITAIKAAGVHLGRLVAPSVLLGLLAGGGTLALYYDFIPRTHLMLRTQVFADVEELLYGLLKKQGTLRDNKMKVPFAMWVRQVQGRRLIDAIIKKLEEKGDGYSFVARAREAQIHYLPDRNMISVDLVNVSTFGENNVFKGNLNEPEPFEIPLPPSFQPSSYQPRPSDLTWVQLLQRRVDIRDEVREAYAQAANPPVKDLPPEQRARAEEAFRAIPALKVREQNNLEVELNARPALAVGCLCFALIGGPVGIWFSRADYLSAFVSCFLPTVFVYYPLLLCGTNLAKEGRLPAAVGLWLANGAAALAALVLYARLLRR